MFCRKCGKELADTAKFCRYCGYEMDSASEQINNPVYVSQPVEEVEDVSTPFEPVEQPSIVTATEQASFSDKKQKKSLFTPVSIGIAASVLALIIAVPLIVIFGIKKGSTTETTDAGIVDRNESSPDQNESSPDQTDPVIVSEYVEDTVPVYDLSYATISPIPDQIYTGNAVTVPIIVSIDGEYLTEGIDYGYYFENNTNLGTARVSIQAMGNNVGSNATTFNIVTGNAVCDDPNNYGAVYMVIRLYYYLLDRYPEPDALIDDVYGLVDGSMSGIDVVNSIINSDEFIGRGLSDEDFLNAFYRGVLNREPDAGGYESNLSILANGVSRSDLVNSIISTRGGEFENICNSSGIRSGI